MKMKKKIIITGAAGFIGLNLVTLIDTKKYEIIAIDKNEKDLGLVKEICPKVKIVRADLKNLEEKWSKYFKGASCVIQLQAQISSPDKEEFLKNNIKSVSNVLAACEKYKIKNLTHISTAGVISVVQDYYSTTKAAGEKLVRTSKIPHTVLRPPMLYGCFEKKHIGYLAEVLDRTPLLPIPGNGKYIRQPIYAKDFCKVILKLIETKPERQVYNIIGKEKIYFIDTLKNLIKAKKQKRILLTTPIPIFLLMLRLYTLITGKKPYHESQLKALMSGDIFASDDWEKKFNVKYTPFKEGIKETINSKYYGYPRNTSK